MGRLGGRGGGGHQRQHCDLTPEGRKSGCIPGRFRRLMGSPRVELAVRRVWAPQGWACLSVPAALGAAVGNMTSACISAGPWAGYAACSWSPRGVSVTCLCLHVDCLHTRINPSENGRPPRAWRPALSRHADTEAMRERG